MTEDWYGDYYISDDAKLKKIKDGYEMPADKDYTELLDNTVKKWIKNYKNIQGLNGILFTGKNGNTLFFPAGGCYYKSVITKLIMFVSKMLYFRSLREANQYIGYKLGGEKLDDIILRNNKLDEFVSFLHEMGLNYNLIPLKLSSGFTVIGAKFENGKAIALNEISSSGTRTLMLFYCWLLEFKNLSFLVIDEFDAYYHYEVSKKVLDIINSFDNLQSVVTTHNVTLLNTEYTRPDCSYIIDSIGVRNLSSRTTKELRRNHNIEKLYREGVFCE